MRAARWRRVLVALNVAVAICLVLVAAAYGYVHWQMGRIHKVDVPSVASPGSGPGSGKGKGADTGPMTVLLVGSDSRKGLSGKDRKAFGTEADSGGERSDVIMLVRIDRTARTARAMSVPRDLWVTLAGTKKEAKVNAAFEAGPDRLVATLRDTLGVQVDHYVQVDFNAFRGIVDALGGVDIPFPAPARDAKSGLHVKQAGCVHLDGDAALQYVRSRHYEQLQDGRWQEDPRQDLGRIERQHGFLRHLAAQADVPASVARVHKLVSSLVTHITVDSGFKVEDMTDLALAYRGRGADALELVNLPVKVGRAGGQSVVFLDDGADAAVATLLHGQAASTPTPTPPAPAPGAARATAPSTTSTAAPSTTSTAPIACR